MAYFIENVKFSPFKNANRLRVTSGYGNRTITINGKTDSNFNNGLDIILTKTKYVLSQMDK